MAKIVATKEEDIVSLPDFQEILEGLAACGSPEIISKFFCDSFTRIELDRLVKRWIAVKGVVQGIPYRTIAQENGISTSTIHLAIESVHRKRGGWEYLLNRYVKERKF